MTLPISLPPLGKREAPSLWKMWGGKKTLARSERSMRLGVKGGVCHNLTR